jgi:DNA-binding transcriptional LysR family regulator
MTAFYAQNPPTRLKLRNEVLNGTWEALLLGHADLALGVGAGRAGATDVQMAPMGDVAFAFVIAPHHPLAQAASPLHSQDLITHRIVAVADTSRSLESLTVGILPGQDVLTVATMGDKLAAIRRGLGCGYLPAHLVEDDLRTGHLVAKVVDHPPRVNTVYQAWRQSASVPGKALAWWLEHLARPATKQALLSCNASAGQGTQQGRKA